MKLNCFTVWYFLTELSLERLLFMFAPSVWFGFYASEEKTEKEKSLLLPAHNKTFFSTSMWL